MASSTNIITSRPLKNAQGVKLDDYDTVKAVLRAIDTYQTTNHRPAPGVSGRFIEWMRGAMDFCKTGRTMTEYKQQTIDRRLDDYTDLCARTEKVNDKLAKKGAFKMQKVREIRGVSE